MDRIRQYLDEPGHLGHAWDVIEAVVGILYLYGLDEFTDTRRNRLSKFLEIKENSELEEIRRTLSRQLESGEQI